MVTSFENMMVSPLDDCKRRPAPVGIGDRQK